MPKRATLLVWAGLSLAYSIGYRLVADAIVGWINDRIAEALSITSPSVMNVLTFVWSWGPPLVLAALTLWSYHLWMYRRLTSTPANASWTQWRASADVVSTLRALSNEHTNVDILFFDPAHRVFAERLASTFDAAGWSVNFTKVAQGPHHSIYPRGIEVKGDNRNYVETISGALTASECALVMPSIVPTAIKASNPKHPMAKNKIWITIGYEQ